MVDVSREARPINGPQPSVQQEEPSNWKFYLLIAGVITGASFFVFPAPSGVLPNGWHALGLLIPVVAIWATEIMSVGVAALLFLAMVVGLHLVSPDVAFKGFTNHLPWLMLGAFSMGAAMLRCGLSQRITYWLLSRFKGLWGITAAAYIVNLCLVAVPSAAARAGMLAPVLKSIIESSGYTKESKIARFLTFNFVNATSTPLSIAVLSGPTTAMMLGIYTTLTGQSLTWLQWLAVMFLPAMVLTAVNFVFSYVFSRPEPGLAAKLRDSKAAVEAYAKLPPMSAGEWRVLALFLLLILLWVIGGQIQLDAGFAALFVMGLLFLPKIGVLPTSALKEINWDITLLIGTSVSIIGIFDQTGMIKVVSTALVAPVLNPLALYGVIGVALGVVIVNLIAHFMLPAPGNIPLAVPLLIGWGTQVAHLPALEVLVVLLLLSALVNQVVVLAYQMPPFYVFLGMEVTDHAKFNGLLVKIWPFATIGALLGALVAYGMVTSLGLSPGT